MIDFISDIINIIKLKRIQKKIKYCFFVENYFIYQYLKPYIDKKKDEDSIIFSFEKLDLNNCNKKIFVLKSTFFRTFFFMTLKFKILITSTPDLENSADVTDPGYIPQSRATRTTMHAVPGSSPRGRRPACSAPALHPPTAPHSAEMSFPPAVTSRRPRRRLAPP